MNMLYKKYFYPFPTLQTERLVLRRLFKSDAADLFEYCASPTSARFGTWSIHEDISDTKSYINALLKSQRRGEYFTWGIIEKSSGKLIGTCSYTEVDTDFKVCEIGYGLIKKYWGNGYAREAVSKIIEYGFCTVGFQKITARVIKENTRSINLVKSLGFCCEGFIKKGVSVRDCPKDVYIFGMTDDEYENIV